MCSGHASLKVCLRCPLPLQLQMWMNALWIGPVTTAASTTLAHSHVLATKGTPSMALPTVEVSRMPTSLKSETGPGFTSNMSPDEGQFSYIGRWTRYSSPCTVALNALIQGKHLLMDTSRSPLPTLSFIPLTLQVWYGAERRTKLFSCEFFIDFIDMAVFREWRIAQELIPYPLEFPSR